MLQVPPGEKSNVAVAWKEPVPVERLLCASPTKVTSASEHESFRQVKDVTCKCETTAPRGGCHTSQSSYQAGLPRAAPMGSRLSVQSLIDHFDGQRDHLGVALRWDIDGEHAHAFGEHLCEQLSIAFQLIVGPLGQVQLDSGGGRAETSV
jgi:hypothetical protein